MVLLENLIPLLLIFALYSALQVMCAKRIAGCIPAVVSFLSVLASAILLIYAKSSLEELFLVLLAFGTISLSVFYFMPSEKKKENETDRDKDEEKTNKNKNEVGGCVK